MSKFILENIPCLLTLKSYTDVDTFAAICPRLKHTAVSSRVQLVQRWADCQPTALTWIPGSHSVNFQFHFLSHSTLYNNIIVVFDVVHVYTASQPVSLLLHCSQSRRGCCFWSRHSSSLGGGSVRRWWDGERVYLHQVPLLLEMPLATTTCHLNHHHLIPDNRILREMYSLFHHLIHIL